MATTRINRLFAAAVNVLAVFLLLGAVTQAVVRAQAQPTAGSLDIAFFSGKPTGAGVVLTWRTGPESNLAGFNVYRAEGANPWEKLNPELIVATGGLDPRNDYAWTDAHAKPGKSYFYLLEDVSATGAATRHEPVRIKAGAPLRLGLDEIDGQLLATVWPAALGAVVAVGGFSLVQRRRR